MRSDPFEPTANPGFYVPRPACELALDALHAALRGGALAVAIAGPTGAGKRMVLRVLEQRLRSTFLTVPVGQCAVSISELGRQILRALAQDGPGPPERGLLAAALRAEADGRPLVLFLEQASALPIETARALAPLLIEGEGSLRCVVRIDDESGRETAHALSPRLEEIGLRAPMSEAESLRFVRDHLERSGASDTVRLRFHDALITRLHRAVGGVPGALSRLAARVAAGDPPDEAVAPAESAPVRPGADPFGPSAATGAYQPRPTTEGLLDRLTAGLASGRRALLLHGPPGLGKTTLLRILGDRLRQPFQSVDVPYGRFDPDDFWRYVLFQLGAPRGDFPENAVLDLVRSLDRRGGVLVLLVDEAQALPEATLTRLAALLHHAEGALRAVLAVGAGASRDAFSALPDAEWFGLDESLNRSEAAEYVAGRLERFDAPTHIRNRFDEGTLGSLFRASRGVPRELNRLAGEIERSEARAPAIPPESETAEEALATTRHKEATRSEAAAAATWLDVGRVGSIPAEPAPADRGSWAPTSLTPEPAADVSSEAIPNVERERIAEVQAAEAARSQLAAPPVAAAEPVRKRKETVRAERTRAPAPTTGFLPHLALAGGIPATLVVLWLWLSPVFAPQLIAAPAAPPPEEIRVHINATPWARVEVDGRPLGVTPLGNVPLARGPHDFRAELPDGRILERRVEISETRRHIAFH